MSQKEIFKDKALGSLWGLAIGDALGAWLEFADKDHHLQVTEYMDGGPHGLEAGDWTDDTAMTLAVCDSLKNGEVDLDGIMRNFCRWMNDGEYSSNGKCFDIGFATETALKQFAKTGRHSTVNSRSKGNGSLMRLAPSVVYAFAHGKDINAVFAISDLTHRNQYIRRCVKTMANVMFDHFDSVKSGKGIGYTTREKCNPDGLAECTLKCALWAFWDSKTFDEGLLKAVNLGGDADTIGAVYGQIAGAWHGLKGIPSKWINGLKRREYLDNMFNSLVDDCIKLL